MDRVYSIAMEDLQGRDLIESMLLLDTFFVRVLLILEPPIFYVHSSCEAVGSGGVHFTLQAENCESVGTKLIFSSS